MFLPNCLAVAGGDLQSIKIDKENCVLIFDNEPRNEHTVKKLMNAIDDGWEVVVWPKQFEFGGYGDWDPFHTSMVRDLNKMKKFKDINDLVMNGLSIDEIVRIINKNTMKGLKANWAARKWRNVH
jgi:hypothetical protein